MLERVILIGFMCSGKSTVGRLLAERLGWEFVDFDDEIERAGGLSITRIFRDQGEEAFRRLEARLTRRLTRRRHVVLAPGGGWVTQPDLVELLRPGSLIVWLRASAETIQRRHLEQGVERPLLAVEEPLAEIRRLLAERESYYSAAGAIVDTDELDPLGVVTEITERLRAARRDRPRGRPLTSG